MKMTFNGRRPFMEDDLKIWNFEYLISHWSDLPQILNVSSWDHTKVKKGLNEDDLQWKMTCNGRWPQNMKIWVSQQPLFGSISNFKHKLMGLNQSRKKVSMKTTFNRRWPLMKDDLKIWKFEYLSSHWSDLPQILNISSWDHTKVI